MFRLALALGLPVRELLARIGSDELTEWMAFYQLEPFGDFRADVRAGIVASTFANANRARDTKPFTPEDFMPFVDKQPAKAPSPIKTPLNVAQFKAMFSHRIKKMAEKNG
ncbi:MAG: DUF4035 domain-containing protein [Burkholderiaceae bacterium]